MNTLGQTIRNHREALGLSLRVFGQKAGVHAPYMSNIERGTKTPHDGLLLRIAAALGVKGEELQQLSPYVPVPALRARCKEDPELAYALRVILRWKVSGKELLALPKIAGHLTRKVTAAGS